MTILHQITVPDTPQSVDIRRQVCVHCDKQLNSGDAFTVRADGYRKRHEFVPCVGEATEG